MIKQFKKRFEKGRLGYSVLSLVSGNFLASAIPIFISPIIARLFSPADFGLFSLYNSIFSFLGLVASGRYNVAILVSKDKDEAKTLGKISLIITLFFCSLCILVVFFFDHEIAAFLGAPELEKWLWILPFSILISGINKIFNSFAILDAEFVLLSVIPVIRAISNSSVCLFLGLLQFGGMGLLLGAICGGIAVLMGYGRKYKDDIFQLFRKGDLRSIKSIARKYCSFPTLELLSSLLNDLSLQVPIFLLSSYYGPAVLGFYSLSMRIINKPTTMFGKAVSIVFKQRAQADIMKQGQCKDVYVKILSLLFLISILPFLVLWISAPSIFAFVYGENWRIAGEYTQILTPMLWLKFIGRPLVFTFYLRMKLKMDFLYQIGFVFVTIVSFCFGGYFWGEVKPTLVVYVLAYSVLFLIYLLHSFFLSKIEQTKGIPNSETI